jgi:chromosome segregation ATPase
MGKLQTQLQALYGDLQNSKDNEEIATRKHKDYETQIFSFRTLISELEGKLRNKDGAVENFAFRESQYQQEIARLTAQCGLLNQEIERLNEFSQKK